MTDDERYERIRRREPGDFVYAVRTTGVYCRPVCAARLARRGNVSFHATPDDAERAGFRACKRCRPRDASPDERRRRIVAAAQRFIVASEDPPTLAAIAAHVGLSRFHFRTLFTAHCGITPSAYALAHRTRRFRDGLRAAATVTAAMTGAGFSSTSRVYERLDGILGMTPRAFRRGGDGTTIRYAIRLCALGRVLVAATERGICALSLGDDARALDAELHASFPQATFVRDGAADADADAAARFAALVVAAVAFVDAPRGELDVPLDILGTAFQQRVWRELRALAPGTTASYRDVARRIGRPTAARAVANACAANAIALAIPCHRVVTGAGEPSGYRWGVARKRALLARERDDA
ncbi:MAG: bifunctional DNA-binding transcriptional regulator/O6-methylguanine-DNA methyltransferase Ada [Vulcanimicrobiaceae bacterium]